MVFEGLGDNSLNVHKRQAKWHTSLTSQGTALPLFTALDLYIEFFFPISSLANLAHSSHIFTSPLKFANANSLPCLATTHALSRENAKDRFLRTEHRSTALNTGTLSL